MAREIIKLLQSFRFPLNNEKELQREIEKVLLNAQINHSREFHFDKKSIIDFLLLDSSIGIEIKISGSAQSIYRQLARYCEFEQINSIILVTNKTIGLPKLINNKPTHVINLGKAWL